MVGEGNGFPRMLGGDASRVNAQLFSRGREVEKEKKRAVRGLR